MHHCIGEALFDAICGARFSNAGTAMIFIAEAYSRVRDPVAAAYQQRSYSQHQQQPGPASVGGLDDKYPLRYLNRVAGSDPVVIRRAPEPIGIRHGDVRNSFGNDSLTRRPPVFDGPESEAVTT